MKLSDLELYKPKLLHKAESQILVHRSVDVIPKERSIIHPRFGECVSLETIVRSQKSFNIALILRFIDASGPTSVAYAPFVVQGEILWKSEEDFAACTPKPFLVCSSRVKNTLAQLFPNYTVLGTERL